VRAEELIEGRPELIAAIRPLLEARNAVGQQVSELDRKVMKLARHDAQVRRFMTVPGVGPITALAFKATIDDPARFARSRSVYESPIASRVRVSPKIRADATFDFCNSIERKADMAGAGPTVGGGSISSKPASADRPHCHLGIFF
jgi:transposase